MGRGKKQIISVALPSDTIEWLDASAKSHSLPSRDKAVRCCINCVAIADVPSADSDGGYVGGAVPIYDAVNIELAAEQIEWLNKMRGALGGERKMVASQSEIIVSVLRSCMAVDDPAVVFGVIRCKSKVNACEGAREAVTILEGKYGDDVEVKEEITLL